MNLLASVALDMVPAVEPLAVVGTTTTVSTISSTTNTTAPATSALVLSASSNDVGETEEVPVQGVDLHHTDERLNALRNGSDLGMYLKNIPPGRCQYNQAWVMGRVLKVLMQYHPDYFEQHPADFNEVSTFSKLNQRAQTLVYVLITSLAKDDESFVPILKAIQNKSGPSNVPVAAICDANSGSVTMNRAALVAHMMVHPEAQKDIIEYHNKFAKSERHVILTQGVTERGNVLATVLLQWCEKIKPLVINPFTTAYPVLKIINPALGVFKDVLQLRQVMNDLKSNYTSLKTRLETSGRNENGEILDSTALQFCRDGNRTTPLSK